MVKGFTLIELMVTLAISSIVLAFSTAGYSNTVQKQRVTADVNSFVSFVGFARSNAIKTNLGNKLCPYQIDGSCGKSWQDIQLVETSSSKRPLVIATLNFSTKYNKIEWRAFQNKNSLSFNSLGYTSHQNGTLYLCHPKKNELHRAIAVSKSGRTTVVKSSDKLNQVCG